MSAGVAHTASSQSAASLVGTWARTTTCTELASAFRSAGMSKLVNEMVVGNGFNGHDLQGVSEGDLPLQDSRQGDQLHALVPKGCQTFRCAWAISVAYPGKTRKRLS